MKYNPLNLKERKEYFYEKKICDFIKAVSFGMMPNKRWNGEYEISGGLLTVKKDGDILCHHIFYDSQSLAKYLYKNTKLETPSTSRHEFANIFKDNIGNYFFKLNLQLRFKQNIYNLSYKIKIIKKDFQRSKNNSPLISDTPTSNQIIIDFIKISLYYQIIYR